VSLRSRIVLVTLSAVAAGLVAADLATYHFLGSFLVDRVDQQLRTAAAPAVRILSSRDALLRRGFPPLDRRGNVGNAGQQFLPSGTFIAILDRSGRIRNKVSLTYDEATPSRPRLPAAVLELAAQPRDRELVTNSSAVGGSTDYRMLARRIPNVGTLLVAMPLTEVRATQRQLLWIELAVTLSVLALLSGVCLWLIRRGLRPLERMSQTAGAIAAGDLSRRVEPDDARSEVGRLGQALNVMLERIEQGFAERQATEERLRRFVADASHELRTPVTSIRGYAELFRRGAAERPADLALAMRRIEEEGARMGVLVEELLQLAQLDQGLPPEHEPVDLTGIASAAVDAARAADPDRPISFQPDRAVKVIGSATRLRQVADNLLANARTHTPAGTPIDVRVGVADGEGWLEVADRGPGIPAGDADRIFERFYRTDESRSRSGANGGAGLGLAIARAVVEAHGGRITYRGRTGGGTIFRMTIPTSGTIGPRRARDFPRAAVSLDPEV
jgi:two-component system, OmpR family, sensor kinase